MGWRDDDDGWGGADDTITVGLRFLGECTDLAVRVALADDHDDTDGVWLPWSQVHSIEDDDGPIDIGTDLEARLEQGEAATFEVSTWLAEREGWA